MRNILLKILLLTVWVLLSLEAGAASFMSTHIALPTSDELHCIYFDRQGLLWIGTSNGVKSYDGYNVREAFTRQQRHYPQLGGDVMSMTEDGEKHLWIGTTNGLVRIDRYTGDCQVYQFPKESQKIIYTLFTSRDGTVYVGTDDGFSIYNKEKDRFKHFNIDHTMAIGPDGKRLRYQGYGVKDFAETPDGDILIGTWQQGLWKFMPRQQTIRSYARRDKYNSAFTLCNGPHGQLWVGTQGQGIWSIDRTDDYRLSTLHNQTSPANDMQHKVIYGMVCDRQGQIHTAIGDTVCIKLGPDGALWKGTRWGGIVRTVRGQDFFHHYATGLGIRSLFTLNGTQFYIGCGNEGLAWYDTATGSLLKNNRVPGFHELNPEGYQTRVTSMIRRWNGELWIAAGDNGVFVGLPDGKCEERYTGQIPAMQDNVLAFCESRKTHVLWIGQRKGVSVLWPDGKGYPLSITDREFCTQGYFIVNHITEDHSGRIWIASATNGIVCISGTPPQAVSYHHYPTPTLNITACFEDNRQQMWAIYPGGLLRLNPKTQRFEDLPDAVNLTGRQVLAINEDRYGNIWLATDQSLVRLSQSSNGAICTASFTCQDGLASTSFFPNATFRYGHRLYFGTQDGFVGFEPPASFPQVQAHAPRLTVTDIMLNGTSYQQLDSLTANELSEALPEVTRQITIPANTQKFGIEFSLLCYSNQTEVQYAYKLDGYHEKWQYVDGADHKAVFEHIPPGTYSLYLKAADSQGKWYTLPYAIQVKVKSPLYATWWALMIYIIIAGILGWMGYDWLRMRQEAKNSRQMSNVLRSVSTSEENNPDGLFMQKALRIINNHLSDSDFNRNVFAKEMDMSLNALYDKLRDLTGLSIQTYISTVRLNAAREILNQEPNIRISDLAYRVGFNTPKYFSQCFKKEFGLLPGEFAQQNKRGNRS